MDSPSRSPIRARDVAQHPLRVLVITNMLPTPARPYFGAFVRTQARDLAAAGADVLVVGDRGEQGGPSATVKKYASLFVRSLWAGLRFRPRIVHTHYVFPTTLPAVLLHKLLGIPVVVTSHRGDVLDMARRSWIHRRLTRYCLAHCAAVIAVSDEIRRVLRDDLGVDDRKIHVIDMGFDATSLPTRSARGDRIVCVFVGLSFERKGGPVLLDAIGKATERLGDRAVFVFIGEFASSAGPRFTAIDPRLVEVRGFLDHDAVLQELANSDVFLLPSRSEGLPVAMLEAMACGAVPIVTPVGDIPTVVRDRENGMLVAVEDSSGLADRIVELVMDQELRNSLSRRARDAARAFDSRRKAEAVRSVYTRLIST